ncbi:MAG: DUF928 domain-containing protein [Oscillatoriales cyanobacterium C42_A2020_001]|nr:DUF928 domain-containing protein [Leptolyngbyaceae cyanobacterium C42_A2020_001]
MTQPTFSQPFALILSVLFAPLVLVDSPSTHAQAKPAMAPAQSVAGTAIAFEPLIPAPKNSRGGGRRLFEPPTGQDAPGTSRGGGRRTDELCPKDRPKYPKIQTPIERKPKTLGERATPLLPTNRWGLTVSERPTFLLYVPKTSAKAMEFTLEDDKGEVNFQMNLPVPSSPGVVRISLPNTAPALEVDKEYSWRVAFACQANIPAPEDPLVHGMVRRVQSTAVSSKPGAIATLETVKQYAKAGIWYDASAGLAALKYSNPKDATLQSTWQDLLSDIQLEALSSAPLKN